MDAIDYLVANKNLPDEGLLEVLQTEQYDEKLFYHADKLRRMIYGDEVYLRGLIEFTNYCKNNCYYCGIRCGNSNISRYRMTQEEIMSACENGYRMGFRTFVLQGGEDPYFTDDKICQIVSGIRNKFPDCAITLSIGEKNKESYQAYYDSGANRYLLRQESASELLYSKLHPNDMKIENRKRCLFELKDIGYQVGAGFMVGAPFQTVEDILMDLRFLQELDPDMIGIGPFISHKDTIFCEYENGSLSLTLRLIAILRLLFPHALIPATTALGTIHPLGREYGLKAGANVVMPNLSPKEVREKYMLYDNKICIHEDSSECGDCTQRRVSSVGYKVVTDIGNVKR
ncbi:MAG: [FeFe] hydrogenase H-cluster radical SAM maturase HydE [Clostridium sp.]|nr:[FeFe] hydrogenase H-cluster radical SAM maturase HydE [Clostridium sp.]